MATKIYSIGTADVTVPAGQKIAIYSQFSATKLYQQVAFPNYPSSFSLVTTATAGTEYVSAAVTADTVFRIEAGPDGALYQVGTSPTTSRNSTGEVPSGTMNGVNKTFTLAHIPLGGINLIYNNATLFTTDFTLSGSTITLGAGVTAPNTANGDTLYVPPYAY